MRKMFPDASAACALSLAGAGSGGGGAQATTSTSTITTTTTTTTTTHAEMRLGDHTLVFPDGPLRSLPKLPPNSKALPNACALFSWWEDEQEVRAAVERVKQVVEAAAERGQPFDGVLGFSQGGALAAVLCRSATPLPAWRPRFAVMLSAYTATPKLDGTTLNFAADPSFRSDVASLHAWGRLDQVVRPQLSLDLCTAMRGDCRPQETGGHAAPPPPFGDQVLRPWLDAMHERGRASASSPSSTSSSSSSSSSRVSASSASPPAAVSASSVR